MKALPDSRHSIEPGLLYGGFTKGSAVNREEEGEKIDFAELPERTIPRDALVMIVAQEANQRGA